MGVGIKGKTIQGIIVVAILLFTVTIQVHGDLGNGNRKLASVEPLYYSSSEREPDLDDRLMFHRDLPMGYSASEVLNSRQTIRTSSGTANVTILGDIDGDGDVDKYDFGLFAGAYGSKAGDAKYILAADLDQDGDVDKYDFGIFAGNYGKRVTVLSVSPPTISKPVGEVFTINITVTSVVDLWVWQAGMTFNPDVLECLSFDKGDFLSQGGSTLWMPGTIDNTAGVVSYGAETATVAPANGSGTLGTLTFRVKDYGTSTLHLGPDPMAENVLLIDPDMNPIPFNVEDGYFVNVVRDVAVTSVMANATYVAPGEAVNVTVVVENQGDFAESFSVTAYYNETAIDTQLVSDLASKASTELYFVWNTLGAYGNYTIKANATAVEGETDTADNELRDGTVLIRIPGDIDGDGDVDKFDFSSFAGAYGSKAGEPKYIAGADLDRDGDVDKFDFGMFAGNYGSSI